MEIDNLTDIVINRAIKIHEDIGPGCFESIYEEILNYELVKAGLSVKRQVLQPLKYDTLYFDKGYRLDMLVEDQLIIELKVKNPLTNCSFGSTSELFSIIRP
jgi:GxxExxY protein